MSVTDPPYTAWFDPSEEIAKHAIEIARRITAAIRERVPKSSVCP